MRDRFAARISALLARIEQLRLTKPARVGLTSWGNPALAKIRPDALADFAVQVVNRHADALIPDPWLRAAALQDPNVVDRWHLQTGTWPVGFTDWERRGNFEAWTKYVNERRDRDYHAVRDEWKRSQSAEWHALWATLSPEQQALHQLGSAESNDWPSEISPEEAAKFAQRVSDPDAEALARALLEKRPFSLPKETAWQPTAVAVLALAEQRALTVGTLDFLKGTLLIFRGSSAEGQLVAAVGRTWLQMLRFLETDPDAVMRMRPREWEEFIAGCYDRDGYQVTLTPSAGDFGRDVIAEKPGVGAIRVLDQVKRYKPGHLVTAEEVRAFLFVAQADRATKGFITTTSDFAPRLLKDPFIAPHIQSGFLEPRSREKTLAWLKDLSKRTIG